jgi:hypothetical protein
MEYRKLCTSSDYLTTLLEEMILSIGPGLTFMVIDGLDECEDAERKFILKTTMELAKNCSNLRLAIGSRDEAEISRVLMNAAQTIFVNTNNKDDIAWYIDAQLHALARELLPIIPTPSIDKYIRILQKPIEEKAKGQDFPKPDNP